MTTTAYIVMIAVILFFLTLLVITVKYSDLNLGILTISMMIVFAFGLVDYVYIVEYNNMLLTQAQYTLEQFSTYEEIYTGALTGSKIDVFDRGDRKDVCITIPVGCYGGWRQYYFHVRPDLSYEHYEP